MTHSKTSLELADDLHILEQQLLAPTEFFNFPRTFITELELNACNRMKQHDGLGHIFALDRLTLAYYTSANSPYFRLIKYGGNEVRVHTTPLTMHLVNATIEYRVLLQLVPYKPYICLSWVDHAIKNTVAVGTSFIHAVLTKDSRGSDAMIREFEAELDAIDKRVEAKALQVVGGQTIPDYEQALWLTKSILQQVYSQHQHGRATEVGSRRRVRQ